MNTKQPESETVCTACYAAFCELLQKNFVLTLSVCTITFYEPLVEQCKLQFAWTCFRTIHSEVKQFPLTIETSKHCDYAKPLNSFPVRNTEWNRDGKQNTSSCISRTIFESFERYTETENTCRLL